MALIHSGMTKKELAEKLGMSSPSLIQRMKRGRFTKSELEKIATAMGSEYKCYFEFPDGNKY